MPGLLGRRLSPVRLVIYLFISASAILFITTLAPVPDSLPVPKVNVNIPGKQTIGTYLPGLHSTSGGAHKTPSINNGTSSTHTWYEHYSWLNPFSTSQDFLESRTVLPPLQKRCPIYAYYDRDVKKSGADDAVMLAWRRAWWAMGLHPVILSVDDAKEHGMYQKVISDRRGAKLEYNILRWLAWERMGGGVMADFRIIPMPTADDALIPYLRRCQFGDKITRFEGLGSALFTGSTPTIKLVSSNITLQAAIPEDITSPADLAIDHFTVDPRPSSIAYYSAKSLSSKYPTLIPASLPKLINAHLHTNFQQRHPEGIVIINPLEPDSDTLTLPEYKLAQRLSMCPESPLPTSCPPHLNDCNLCDANTRITLSRSYENKTSVFTIGAIPHPVTLQALVYDRPIQDIDFIRRNSTRDEYLRKITDKFAAEGTGSGYRAVKLKSVIAEPGEAKSIWTSVERGWDMNDVEWVLGFTLPETIPSAPHIRQNQDVQDKQKKLLGDAKDIVNAGSKGLRKVRGAVEGWNLGDFEVWKFVRAYEERRRGVRERWEREEKGFGKGLEERKGRWGKRWF